MTRDVAVSDTSASTSVVMSSHDAGILNTSDRARRHAAPIGNIARMQPIRPKRRSNDPRELSPVFMPITLACAERRQVGSGFDDSEILPVDKNLSIVKSMDDPTAPRDVLLVILQRHRISLRSVCFKVGKKTGSQSAAVELN